MELHQEQYQNLGLMDTIKTMFLWMETPEERIEKEPLVAHSAAVVVLCLSSPELMKSALPPVRRPVLGYVAWLALCFAASASAVFVSPGGWYAELHKPSWNPPSWIFGPAWTMLYILMATAAWLVWREGGWKVQGRALSLFVAQWLLNALWTPLSPACTALTWPSLRSCFCGA